MAVAASAACTVSVFCGEGHHRNRHRAEGHEGKAVVGPLGDELAQQVSHDLGLGFLRHAARGLKAVGVHRRVHAAAAVHENEHLGAAPGTLDHRARLARPGKAQNGEGHGADRECAPHEADKAADPIRRQPGHVGKAQRVAAPAQERQQRERQQGEHPGLGEVEAHGSAPVNACGAFPHRAGPGTAAGAGRRPRAVLPRQRSRQRRSAGSIRDRTLPAAAAAGAGMAPRP